MKYRRRGDCRSVSHRTTQKEDKMELHSGLCLCLVLATAWTSVTAQMLDPRGNRPVEQGMKSDKCAPEREYGACIDDDWGPKCPSGCRVQGLLDKTDHELLTKIDKIRRLLDDYNQKYRSTDSSSKQAYDHLRQKLTTSSGNDNKYMTLTESLRRRILDIKIKIDGQLKLLEAMKGRVRDQVIEMQRLEVDIDIKLRSCKGSCAEYAEFSVDRDSYVALDKQMDTLEAHRQNSVETVGALRVLKSVEVVSPILKSGGEQQQYFEGVGQSQLTLYDEGGSAVAPATVGKGPGTSPYSDKSLTSLSGGGGAGGGGGGGFGGFEGGFEEFGIGSPSFSSFDSSKTMSSSSFSSSGTKTMSSTKSLLSSSGTKSGAFGSDFGAFGRGDVDDSLPDIFARSGRPGTQSEGKMEKIPTEVE